MVPDVDSLTENDLVATVSASTLIDTAFGPLVGTHVSHSGHINAIMTVLSAKLIGPHTRIGTTTRSLWSTWNALASQDFRPILYYSPPYDFKTTFNEAPPAKKAKLA